MHQHFHSWFSLWPWVGASTGAAHSALQHGRHPNKLEDPGSQTSNIFIPRLFVRLAASFPSSKQLQSLPGKVGENVYSMPSMMSDNRTLVPGGPWCGRHHCSGTSCGWWGLETNFMGGLPEKKTNKTSGPYSNDRCRWFLWMDGWRQVIDMFVSIVN